MPDRVRVMIVDDVSETREQLTKLLSFDPDIEVVAAVGSGEEAVEVVAEASPDVILMDINLPGMDGVTATAKIIEIVPTVQVIMLSVQGETDYMRRAMMAGARDYLTKPPATDELLSAIHKAYRLKQKMVTGPLRASGGVGVQPGAAPIPEHRAKIVTVYSPKGGTGCTTVAVNLAVALQVMMGSESRICLVDGNLQFGDVSLFMKLQPSRTLADLAPHALDLDPDLLGTVAATHASGVRLLAAPKIPEDAEVFHEGGVDESGANLYFKAVLEFARAHFDYMIVDTAHQIDDVLLALFDLSDLFLVLTRPIIPDIRGARIFLELLRRHEYDLSHIGLVINGVDKRMGIRPEAIEKAMVPALVHLPLDERTALKAANLGEPIMMRGGRTILGQGLRKLAEIIHQRLGAAGEGEDGVSEGVQSHAGFGRLL